MFCPNCGTQNESAATPCKKCGFKLSSISVPKFKGTMMLNSDQTVQDMIEEHRRKQGEFAERRGRGSEPPPNRPPSNPPPSNPPPSSGTSPRGAVLQPPRAALNKRRMGGTMMGVAPQAGGIAPPSPGASPRAPQPPHPPDPEASPHRDPGVISLEPPKATTTSDSGPAEVLAGTLEVPKVDPPARPRSTPPPGHTRPFERPILPPEEKAASPAPPATEPPRRAVAKTAPLPQVPETTSETDFEAASRAIPPRLTALDILLIVCTCGLYALVLRGKQRKPPSA